VFEDQIPRINEMLGNITSLVSSGGYQATRGHGFGYQLGLKNINGRVIEKELQLDIFIFTREGRAEGNYVIQDIKTWPNSYYKNKEEVLPTLDCYLWDIKCKCPRLTTELMKREFSDDVLYMASKYNHADAAVIKFDLRKEENRALLLPQMTLRIQEKLTFY
jgi:hypothetical protein